MWSSDDNIAMGGGGGSFGFMIDTDFQYGQTSPCETYNNPHLTGDREQGRFAIINVEVWGFTGLTSHTLTE